MLQNKCKKNNFWYADAVMVKGVKWTSLEIQFTSCFKSKYLLVRRYVPKKVHILIFGYHQSYSDFDTTLTGRLRSRLWQRLFDKSKKKRVLVDEPLTCLTCGAAPTLVFPIAWCKRTQAGSFLSVHGRKFHSPVECRSSKDFSMF